jgi:hypothetical protein
MTRWYWLDRCEAPTLAGVVATCVGSVASSLTLPTQVAWSEFNGQGRLVAQGTTDLKTGQETVAQRFERG